MQDNPLIQTQSQKKKKEKVLSYMQFQMQLL